MSTLRISTCGEAALRVESHSTHGETDWRTVHNLARHLRQSRLPGLHDAVPTYDSVLLEFSPEQTDGDTLSHFVRLIESTHDLTTPIPPARKFLVPVVYGGDRGPDLGFVAEHLHISEQEVIDQHTGHDLVVRCLGGPAASCMTDGPGFSRPIPRLPDPRVSVPARAVSVAGEQGVIGPVRAPSGWRFIGMTPLDLFSPEEPGLAPYTLGDVVRFQQIAEDQWDAYEGRSMKELIQP